MFNGFYDYLRSVGYNDNGANEVIRRFDENRPDREDLYYLHQFNNIKKEVVING